MDWIKIENQKPRENAIVWVKNCGLCIKATFSKGVFSDMVGNLLPEVKEWTTLHVQY